jgi:hypothetical protein
VQRDSALFESPELLDLAVVETSSLLGSLQSLFVYQLPSTLLPSSETEVFSALVKLKAGVEGSKSSIRRGASVDVWVIRPAG